MSRKGGTGRKHDKDGDGEAKGPMVQLRKVDKTFRMGSRDVHALRDVSMDLPRGVMASIQGTSGSGKTTLLNLIGAMDVPTRGTVKVTGQDLGRLTEEALTEFRKRNVGFVFQFFNLIPTLNAIENVLVPVMFHPEPPTERALGLLDRVGLGERWDHRPSQLSGGERQRLAVARALINDPPLVLADEPTGNLDSRTGARILELFKRLHQEGNTILLVSHDQAVGGICRRIVRLRDGLIEDHPHTGS